MDTRGKINAILWNVEINLQKIGRYMCIMNCQQICKISCKTLNQNENIPKSFRGATFLKHPVPLLIEDCGFHPYDTQIYGFCSSTPSSCTEPQSRISECIDVACSWMRSHRLQLNTAKTEIIWLTTGPRSYLLPQLPLRVGSDLVINHANPCGPWAWDSQWRRRFYEISRHEDHVCLFCSFTSASGHPLLGT